LLINSLKEKGVIAQPDSYIKYSSPTGFTIIDTLGGEIGFNKDGMPVLNWGLTNKNYLWAGESSTGKTTLCLQLMAGSVKLWNDTYPDKNASDLIMIDAEDNLELSNVIRITGWSHKYLEEHFMLEKMNDITKIYNLITNIANMKEKNKSKYMVDTDIIDIDGKPVKSWIMTYILIDSVAALKSDTGLENIEKDKTGEIKYMDQISGNIDNMREAARNTNFILKIKPLLNKHGICLIMINHFVQETQMSMFDVLKRYLPSLRPGQKIKGGKELIFQAYAIGNLEAKEKLNEKNPIYGEDVYGGIVNFAFVKSKTSEEGIYHRLVFDAKRGYRPDLSDFEYLYNKDYGLEGSHIRMHLSILPEITFTRKTLSDLIDANPLLARAIQFQARLKMIYDMIYRIDAPDIQLLGKLPYCIRVALIISYTLPYPGRKELDFDLDIILEYGKGLTFINTTGFRFNSLILAPLQIELLNEDVDGLKFVSDTTDIRTPYDDPVDFIIEKENGKEFWIRK
jgi:RecA/RadA recombinase